MQWPLVTPLMKLWLHLLIPVMDLVGLHNAKVFKFMVRKIFRECMQMVCEYGNELKAVKQESRPRGLRNTRINVIYSQER